MADVLPVAQNRTMAVLLVEDDVMVRLTLADFFEVAGCDFLEAGNAEGAMAILSNPLQPIDILVTDLDLSPGDNGLALAVKARQRQPEVVMIYETGSRRCLPAIPCPLGAGLLQAIRSHDLGSHGGGPQSTSPLIGLR